MVKSEIKIGFPLLLIELAHKFQIICLRELKLSSGTQMHYNLSWK
jgi:hypothetical protein